MLRNTLVLGVLLLYNASGLHFACSKTVIVRLPKDKYETRLQKVQTTSISRQL